ncbi:DNA cytosine methyltransferase, partial [Catenulispora yoronensis]
VVGKWNRQYDYRCPACGAVTEPHTRPAASIIDFTDRGTTIAEKTAAGRPPKPYTLARLAACIDYLQADNTRRTGTRRLRPNGAQRVAVIEWRNHCDGASGWEPFSGISAQGNHHGIVLPPPGWSPGEPLDVGDLTYRVITDHEQKLAQCFRPDYIVHGDKREERTLQIGNAVPPNMARWIGETIQDAVHTPGRRVFDLAA